MLLSRLLSRQAAQVLSPTAWQAWAPASIDAGLDRVSEEPEGGAALAGAEAMGSDALSTRDVILNAAEQRFAERGFAGVAMREIAAAAGLKNPASLYHYFRSKRALYEAVLSRGLAPVVALVIKSGEAGGRTESGTSIPRAVLDATLDRLVDYLAEHPHLPRLIQRAGLDDSRYMRSGMAEVLFPLYAEGLRVLAAASPWKPADIPHVAAGIFHLIFGYFANAGLLEPLLQADPFSPDAVARQRHFVKTAVAQLLGLTSERASGSGEPESRDA